MREQNPHLENQGVCPNYLTTYSMLPGPNLGTVLGTPHVLEGDQIAQVIENKMVGDTGFEPVTSTV